MILLAYHGCDLAVRDGVLRGELAGLKPSANEYDWLGDGIYFFVGDLRRAESFARTVSENQALGLTAQPILRPAVLGAYVELGLHLNMSTMEGRGEYATAVLEVHKAQEAAGAEKLENKKAWDGDNDILHRMLDRAAFNMIHFGRKDQSLPRYDAVISPFPQGQAIVQGPGLLEAGYFRHLSHVQMALCNDACIKGWFLPPGQALASDANFATAKAELEAAIQEQAANGGKRRIKARHGR